MSTSEKPAYRIGLGKPFLTRARWIFFIILFAVFNLLAASVYVGAHTGKLDEQIVRPVLTFFDEFVSAMQENTADFEPLPTREQRIEFTTQTTIETTVTSDGSSKLPAQPSVQTIYLSPSTPYPTIDYPSYSGTSYEERLDQMQKDADARWQEALDRQADLRAESQASLDAFSTLNEKCAQEFHDNQGTFVSEECINR